MTDDEKTRAQLIEELQELRRQLACCEGLSERSKAELADSEERYRVRTELLPVGVYEFDGSGRFSYVNQSVTRLLGYSSEELLGMHVEEVLAPEYKQLAMRVLRELRGGEGLVAEPSFVRKDGSTFAGEIHLEPCHEQGRAGELRGVILDITARRKAEQELIRTDKLEAIAVLSGGIAHDFNNILTAILGYLNMAELALPPDSKAASFLKDSLKATLRARDLTAQLLTFAKGSTPVKKPASLGSLIRDATRFSFRGTSIQLRLDLPGDLWPAEVDEGQIAQVINNLAIHAVQAMPDGGLLEMSARNATIEREGSGLKKGRYVELSVRDHGPGIPQQQLLKVFDPYFTSKENGARLGLATCYAIVRRHRGTIHVESEPGAGTTFHLYLPAAETLEKDGTIRTKKPYFGRGRILVMDDDEMIRLVLDSMLVQLGHEVVVAPHGAAAVELYRNARIARRPFDAVIVDLVVPGGMGGVETLKRLQEIDPHVKAIVSSGYANDPVVESYLQHGFAGYLCKPYRFDELVETLGTVLAG